MVVTILLSLVIAIKEKQKINTMKTSNLTTGQKKGLLEMLEAQTSPMTPTEIRVFAELKAEAKKIQVKILKELRKVAIRLMDCTAKITKYGNGFYYSPMKRYEWEEKQSVAYELEDTLLSKATEETKDSYFLC